MEVHLRAREVKYFDGEEVNYLATSKAMDIEANALIVNLHFLAKHSTSRSFAS